MENFESRFEELEDMISDPFIQEKVTNLKNDVHDLIYNLPNLPQAEAPQSRSVNPLLADVLAEIDDKVGGGYGFNNWKDAVVKVLSKYFS